jgi:hypothetical protein
MLYRVGAQRNVGAIVGSVPGVTTEEIRRWAMALPEVTERQHHLLKVPLWQVCGQTFLGMGRDEATAVFCIAEDAARSAAGSDPEHATAVYRRDARRSVLGLEVQLADVPAERVEDLVGEAWAAHAPKRLLKEYTASASD